MTGQLRARSDVCLGVVPGCSTWNGGVSRNGRLDMRAGAEAAGARHRTPGRLVPGALGALPRVRGAPVVGLRPDRAPEPPGRHGDAFLESGEVRSTWNSSTARHRKPAPVPPANTATGISWRLVAENPTGRSGDPGSVTTGACKWLTARQPRRDLQHAPEGADARVVGDLGKTTCQRLPQVLSWSWR